MNNSIFPVQSLVREKCRWDEYLDVLTPVYNAASGRRYKREDCFAPLGYGGINGSNWIVGSKPTAGAMMRHLK